MYTCTHYVALHSWCLVFAGRCPICQFFEKSLTYSERGEKGEVPAELLTLSRCSCVVEEIACDAVSDSPGVTPLHIAAGHADISVVKFLLERGAAVNAVTLYSHTPLQVS